MAGFALLDIFYGEVTYRVREQSERVTVDSLISKIGGSMGIWAGMSLVTVVQLLLYVLYGVLQCFGIGFSDGQQSAVHVTTKGVGVQTVNDSVIVENLHDPVKRYQLR